MKYILDGKQLTPQDYYRMLIERAKAKNDNKTIEFIKQQRDKDSNLGIF